MIQQLLQGHRRPQGRLTTGGMTCAGLILSFLGPLTGGAVAVDNPQAPRPVAVADPLPDYFGKVTRLGPDVRERMAYSHHRGCPVRLRDLRYLRMRFVGYAGAARVGEMVVHENQASGVVDVFHRLYDARFRIRRMQLVDDFQGDDGRSMSANNTSAYNCRRTINGDRWSEHSYGRAIDVNPIQNPYVNGSFVAPKEGRPYAWIDRSAGAPYIRGATRSRDIAVSAFKDIGWEWGGYWTHSKDYQHFSVTGR